MKCIFLTRINNAYVMIKSQIMMSDKFINFYNNYLKIVIKMFC